jgi:4-amino-4-deoxy-L-arabinose transferase-like glycosyltransferase
MEHRSASLQRVRLPALLAAVCALPSLKHARLTALLATICALPILLYLPFLHEPLMRDEGFYAAVGQLILDGDLPYRDAFDNKPPLVFGWYALSFLIFGQHVWAPRLVAAILVSVTTFLVYVQGRLIFSGREALLAALAFALSIGLARFGTNANTEYFMLLPLVAGLVTFTLGHQTGRLPWFLLSGVLNGIAIMTKEVSVFNLGFLILWTLYPAWRRGDVGGHQLASVTLLLGGCSLAVAMTIAPFLVVGAFADVWDAAVVYTLHYVGDRSAAERVIDLALGGQFPFVFAGPWMALSLFGIVYVIRGGEDRWGWLLAGWLVAGVISIIFVGRIYAHYYVHLLPALSLMVPLGVRFLRNRWQVAPARAGAFVLLVGVLAAGAIAMNGQVYLHDSVEERHLSKFPHDPMTFWEIESPALARYVADNTSPDDRIFNLGFQSELYFYADRRSPTRYLFDHLFLADESLVEDTLKELKEETPTFVIDSARYGPPRKHRYDRSGFDQFLADRYEYLGKMYYADIYRLKEEAASDSSGNRYLAESVGRDAIR